MESNSQQQVNSLRTEEEWQTGPLKVLSFPTIEEEEGIAAGHIYRSDDARLHSVLLQ